MVVYPLIFQPIFKLKPWGGRRMETILGKRLPAHVAIGESWEISDLEGHESIVASEQASGKTLHQLLREWGEALYGRAPLIDGRFPLLIKFIDAREPLSIQVHPGRPAAERDQGANSKEQIKRNFKEEAWFVIEAAPDAFMYRGLRPGVDLAAVERALKENRIEELLQRQAVRTGHCYFIPGGTVHSLGGGTLVAEIQTPCDITYRLNDWGRIDSATGAPRELHIQESLDCMRLKPADYAEERKEHVGSVWTSVTTLIRSDAFIVERVRMVEGVVQQIPYDEMVIWIVLEGGGIIHHGGPESPTRFAAGDTVLLPAGLRDGKVETQTSSCWLEVTLPVASSLAGLERPERRELAAPGMGERYVPLRVPRQGS